MRVLPRATKELFPLPSLYVHRVLRGRWPQAVHSPVEAERSSNGIAELKSLPYAPVAGAETPKCVAAAVEVVDNNEETMLRIQVPDYPGLLRVISWVIKGLDLRVKAASLKTLDNGMAHDVLTISTLTGQKLSKARAQEVADRLADFVMYCSPSPKAKILETVSSDGVEICNKSHHKYTVVRIYEQEEGKQGFLLDVASMLTGVGLNVREAEITSPGGSQGRVFSFSVCNEHGGKLSPSAASTVLYVVSLMMGKGQFSLVVPSASFR